MANFTEPTAGKNGRAVVIDGSAWNSSGGPIAARTGLRDVSEVLADDR
ncbi:hypothetical protein IPZ68_12405 [Streptomyces arenae]|nr:hypothetical protein [Streptomyces arenae]